MQDLKITGVQSNLKWQDKDHNLKHLRELLDQQSPETDVIVLPEMFSTAFSMDSASLAEPMDGPGVTWMQQLAYSYDCAICGSLIIKEDGQYYNRFIWVEPSGVLHTYDKHHLFSLLEEDHHYTAGKSHTIFEYKGWRIQPFICYDLRFPAWCRNVHEADLQIFVANWPERRSGHWSLLLQARAIENQCYVAGVNRIGLDKNEVNHTGDSAIYNAYGETLVSYRSEEKVFTVSLSAEHLQKCREKFPFLKDRDHIRIE